MIRIAFCILLCSSTLNHCSQKSTVKPTQSITAKLKEENEQYRKRIETLQSRLQVFQAGYNQSNRIISRMRKASIGMQNKLCQEEQRTRDLRYCYESRLEKVKDKAKNDRAELIRLVYTLAADIRTLKEQLAQVQLQNLVDTMATAAAKK